MTEKENKGKSLSFLSALCLVFITLKLCGYIDWSWIIVLSPMWVPTAIAIMLVVVMGSVAFLTRRSF